MHCGDEPAAGARGVVVERGAVSVLGAFRVDDGGAPVADGLLPRLQVHLRLVAPPGAVLHRHHCLTEGGGCGDGVAVNLVLVVLVRVVLDLRVAPRKEKKHIIKLTQGGSIDKRILQELGSIVSLGVRALLLDFLLWCGVDLDAFSEEHRMHASLWVSSCGVQQQVGQLCRGNTRVTI